MSAQPPPDRHDNPRTVTAMRALTAAIAQDQEECTDALQEILLGGGRTAFAAVCGWASVVSNTLDDASATLRSAPRRGRPHRHRGPGARWLSEADAWTYLEVIDGETGQVISLDETSLSLPHRDAIRIVVATKNSDYDTSKALFRTYWYADDSEPLFQLMDAMLSMAASAARYRLAADIRQHREQP